MAFAAVLDANVLYPIALTDFFLTTAGRRLFRPHWGSGILAEVERNLLQDRPDLVLAQVRRRLEDMNAAHPGALVDPPEELVAAMPVNAKDRHVLAAAVVARAEVVVTFNLKDFPAAACAPLGVEAQHPDVFAEHLVDLDPQVVWDAVVEMSSRRTRPPMSPEEVCDRLARDLPQAVDRLRS